MADEPLQLYKYQPFGPYTAHNLVMLLSQEALYLPKASFLNDPTDCEPHIVVENDSDSLLASLRKISSNKKITQYFRQEALKIIDRIVDYNSTEEDVNANSTGIWDRYINPNRSAEVFIRTFIKSEIGTPRIFSMSSEWNITQMWSYYADSHRGFCIGVSNIEPGDAAILDRVIYSDRRPQILIDDILSLYGRSVRTKRTLSDIYFEKSNAWREEHEYRVVLRQRMSEDSRVIMSLPTGDYYKFPDIIVESITFGLRCDELNRRMIREVIRDQKADIDLFQVVQHDDTYDLSREELDHGPQVPPISSGIWGLSSSPNLSEKLVRNALAHLATLRDPN